jgi:hypothetical protein
MNKFVKKLRCIWKKTHGNCSNQNSYLVGLLDILGTKDADSEKIKVINGVIEKFKSMISHTFELYKCTPQIKRVSIQVKMIEPQFYITQSGDHIIFTCSFEGDTYTKAYLLNAVINHLVNLSYSILSREGIALRGALTIEKLDISNYPICVNNQIEAWKLEKLAIYPRVILSEEIINFLREIDKNNQIIYPKWYLKEDYDGKIYIDYFYLFRVGDVGGGYFSLLNTKSHIEKSLTDNKQNQRVFEKWQWLAKNFNCSLREWRIKNSGEMSTLEPIESIVGSP